MNDIFGIPAGGMEDDMNERMAKPANQYMFSRPEEKSGGGIDPSSIMKLFAMFGGG